MDFLSFIAGFSAGICVFMIIKLKIDSQAEFMFINRRDRIYETLIQIAKEMKES